MSNIQAQIKALQRKQAALDSYDELLALVSGRKDPEGHEGLAAEITAEITTFVNAQKDRLEGRVQDSQSPVEQSQPSASTLTAEEVDLVRMMLRRIPGKAASVPANPPTPTAPAPKLDPNDPLRFMMANRHFDGKRVSYQSPHGEVQGKVQGIVAPNILVKLDTGVEIGVVPDSLTILN